MKYYVCTRIKVGWKVCQNSNLLCLDPFLYLVDHLTPLGQELSLHCWLVLSIESVCIRPGQKFLGKFCDAMALASLRMPKQLTLLGRVRVYMSTRSQIVHILQTTR